MSTELKNNLIAPCGMNCGLCYAYLRAKNTCLGCRCENKNKIFCQKCIIKNCVLLAQTTSNLCYECSKYPCTRLKQLDKRYRLKYKMSMIENLDHINRFGLDNFVQKEAERWECPTCGGSLCVHKGYCLNCEIIISKCIRPLKPVKSSLNNQIDSQ
ncbi:MAG: DUF3795 domain-containing protein [Bacteroidota bacterium]